MDGDLLHWVEIFCILLLFNIADLKRYFEEEDEIASKMIWIQEEGMMRTSLLLIQPLHLWLPLLMYHNYKDLSQELVHMNSIIRYFRL
jgi:hypothetical protein